MAPFVVIRNGAKHVEYRETRAEWMRQQHLKLHESVYSSFERDSDAAHAHAQPPASSNNNNDLHFETHERYDDSDSDSGNDSDTDEHQRVRPHHRSRFRFGRREHRTRDAGHTDDDNNADDSDGIRTPPRSSASSTMLGLSTELFAHASMRGLHCAECDNLVADRDDIVAKTFFGRTGKAFLMNSMFNVTLGSPRSRYLMTGMHTIADVSCSVCASVLGWKYIKAMEASQQYKEGKFIVEKALVTDTDEEQTWQRH